MNILNKLKKASKYKDENNEYVHSVSEVAALLGLTYGAVKNSRESDGRFMDTHDKIYAFSKMLEVLEELEESGFIQCGGTTGEIAKTILKMASENKKYNAILSAVDDE